MILKDHSRIHASESRGFVLKYSMVMHMVSVNQEKCGLERGVTVKLNILVRKEKL